MEYIMNRLFIRQLIVAILLLGGVMSAQRAESGEAIQSAGDVVAALLPATAGIATLALKDREGSVQLVKSTALAMGSALALKYAVDEKRPNGDDYSFPSGHSATAFSAAEFIRSRYGWETGIPAYVAASFVAYSRVESDQHYVHDVLAGAIIGIGSSYLFTTPYKGLSVSGSAAPGYYGVRVSSNW